MLRPRLLIVEDDVAFRMLLRTALSIEGFDVEVARNGYEALQRIDRNPPQVVLLDLGLPDVDGITVLADLAARPDTRRIPVVVVTGRSDPLDDLDARSILRKPVSPEAVVSVARACLANRTAVPARRANSADLQLLRHPEPRRPRDVPGA